MTAGAPFRKVLVANRGEIAVRVIRTCKELGIATVAVYSEVDRDALHVRLADEAHPIGPAAPSESYLAIDRIVETARRAGADAIHPGYGFLSENAAFAEATSAAGLTFVGPPAKAMRALGDKTGARKLAASLGIPVAPGTMEPVADVAAARAVAERVGYPVMLKPAGGGGGKGMRVVRAAAELEAAWRGATGEARTAFGAPALLVERLVERARHVEMQVLADAHGNVIWLGERDCSIQRRHQKLIEETPGPSVDETLRARLGDAAVRLSRAGGYVNAGTCEFLVDPEGRFVFLEMNTRLQVEHPVTELVTGLDLVALQLRVAAGERLPFAQEEVVRRGAALELRITSEDPYAGFLPAGGRIAFLREPAGPHVRVDGGLSGGSAVPADYDPLLLKVVVWGATRAEAVGRARGALAELAIGGVPTSAPFHRFALGEPDFVAGRYGTDYVATHWPPPAEPALEASASTAAALAAVHAVRARARRRPAPRGVAAWSAAARAEALR